jgi:transcriptional regulator with XRE-family HTH domain
MRQGRPYITFSRRAPSIREAILSAIDNVRNAKIGADVLRVDYCNLVTQADIARKINRSRQLVSQYMSGERGPGGFPPPACAITEKVPLWLWCEVAYWLWQNNMVKEDVLRDAQDVELINNVLELARHKADKPESTREVIQAVSPGICPQ